MPKPDTTVKYFESTMTGAPVLNGVAGALVNLLDACLVNGFGTKNVDSLSVAGGVATATISTGFAGLRDAVVEIAGATSSTLNGQHKLASATATVVTFLVPDEADGAATGTITIKLAPAGWTKAFAGTNKAAYKSGNVAATATHYRIDDAGTTTARIRGYEEMTDVNTGTGLFPTEAQLAGGNFVGKSNAADSSARRWCLIANDRFVYFMVAATNNEFPSFSTIVAFGDIASRKSADGYRGYLAAGVSADAVSTRAGRGGNIVAYFGDGASAFKHMPRAYHGIGTAIRTGACSFLRANGANSSSGEGPAPFPNPADNGLLASEMHVVEPSGTIRGRLPGFYAITQSIYATVQDNTDFDSLPELPGRRLKLRVQDITTDVALTYGASLWDVTGPWAT